MSVDLSEVELGLVVSLGTLREVLKGLRHPQYARHVVRECCAAGAGIRLELSSACVQDSAAMNKDEVASVCPCPAECMAKQLTPNQMASLLTQLFWTTDERVPRGESSPAGLTAMSFALELE
jgi:hypothetical protein